MRSYCYFETHKKNNFDAVNIICRVEQAHNFATSEGGISITASNKFLVAPKKSIYVLHSGYV